MGGGQWFIPCSFQMKQDFPKWLDQIRLASILASWLWWKQLALSTILSWSQKAKQHQTGVRAPSGVHREVRSVNLMVKLNACPQRKHWPTPIYVATRKTTWIYPCCLQENKLSSKETFNPTGKCGLEMERCLLRLTKEAVLVGLIYFFEAFIISEQPQKSSTILGW